MTQDNQKEKAPTQIKALRQSIQAEDLISQAIERNLPVENLERLLAFAKEIKAIQAKEAFNLAMAQLQAELPIIEKDKSGGTTDTGKIAYKYAPLESIVEQTKGLIQKHGFSYSFNMELIENGTTKVKVIIKITHQLGHSEVSDMTVPLGAKTRVMSDTQVVAAAQTFAKRYAFCNGFGILTGDEDNDGQTAPLSTSTSKAPQMPKSDAVDAPKAVSEANKDLPATAKQKTLIKSLMKQKGFSTLTEAGIEKIENPTMLHASMIIKKLMTFKKEDDVIQLDAGAFGQIDEPLPNYIPNHEGD